MAWVHRLVSVDGDQGVCVNCGPVAVTYRMRDGKLSPRCGIARRQQQQHRGTGKRPHGLTAGEAQDYVAGKVCAICGTAKDLCVDHCHDREVIRGVLCRSCNTGLGMFKDSPANLTAALTYLEASFC